MTNDPNNSSSRDRKACCCCARLNGFPMSIVLIPTPHWYPKPNSELMKLNFEMGIWVCMGTLPRIPQSTSPVWGRGGSRRPDGRKGISA